MVNGTQTLFINFHERISTSQFMVEIDVWEYVDWLFANVIGREPKFKDTDILRTARFLMAIALHSDRGEVFRQLAYELLDRLVRFKTGPTAPFDEAVKCLRDLAPYFSSLPEHPYLRVLQQLQELQSVKRDMDHKVSVGEKQALARRTYRRAGLSTYIPKRFHGFGKSNTGSLAIWVAAEALREAGCTNYLVELGAYLDEIKFENPPAWTPQRLEARMRFFKAQPEGSEQWETSEELKKIMREAFWHSRQAGLDTLSDPQEPCFKLTWEPRIRRPAHRVTQ